LDLSITRRIDVAVDAVKKVHEPFLVGEDVYASGLILGNKLAELFSVLSNGNVSHKSRMK